MSCCWFKGSIEYFETDGFLSNSGRFLHGDQDMEDILGGASWNLPSG